jgi:hypothetical protein
MESDLNALSSIRPNGLEPGRLWSRWDIMIKFDVRLLITRMSHLERLENELLGHTRRPAHPLGMQMLESDSPDAIFTDCGRKWVWTYLEPLQDELKPLNLVAAQLEIQNIWNHAHEWSGRRMAEGMKTLRWTIEEQLRDLFFLYLDAKEAELFDNKSPLGDDVLIAFPSTSEESREAAQCFALGRHTACVFHCMRVLETGLHIMAADVGVNFDIQNWQNVIDQIESKVKNLGKTLPRGSAKTERMKFLSEASKEFTYFKDGWRNHVAHNRSSHDANQAASMLNHIKAFMGSLAKWLKE